MNDNIKKWGVLGFIAFAVYYFFFRKTATVKRRIRKSRRAMLRRDLGKNWRKRLRVSRRKQRRANRAIRYMSRKYKRR